MSITDMTRQEGLLIGLDVGTSRAKAVLVSSSGQTIARATTPYRRVSITDKAIEQDASEWWQVVCGLIRQLADQAKPDQKIRALALSTQGGSLVMTDAGGEPLSPAITWQDQRGETMRPVVLSDYSNEQIHDKTGWQLGKGLNLLQILRVRETDPALFSRARCFLSTSDFLALKLTGRAAIDASNAGINQLLDITTKHWDPDLLRLTGLDAGHLADIIPSGTPVGRLLPEVSLDLGLDPDTMLVSGGHDQYCAALGAGAIHTHDRLIGTGTAWVILEVAGQAKAMQNRNKAISHHVVPGLWGHLMSLPFGGAALEWIRSALDLRDICGQRMPFTEIDRQIEPFVSDATRPFFYPYMQGCPYPPVAGPVYAAFGRLMQHHDWRAMAASVLEGVVLQVCWMWDAYPDGKSETAYIMTGGASASPLWRQMLANALNQPVTIPENPDIGCLGAAMLAGIGAGLFPDAPGAYAALSQASTTVRPDGETRFFQERLRQYKQLQRQMFG
ncbi:MAG: FGGY-family carbohydrate kinase [Eubacteriales bacterium]|nr:FGGY-family carbohydrate kinase [Eubacteriales bacterium]